MRRLLFALLWALLCATASVAQNNSALTPQALPGLNMQVRGGTILLASSSIGISNTTVALSNNTTNYVFLSSTGVVQTNTTGFTSTVLPIATVLTAQGQIVSIMDNRPDYIFAGGSGLPAGPTSPNSRAQVLTSTPTGGVAGIGTYGLPGDSPTDRPSAETSYTLAVTDIGTSIRETNGAGEAFTIPDGNTSGFVLPVNIGFIIEGGTSTIARTTASQVRCTPRGALANSCALIVGNQYILKETSDFNYTLSTSGDGSLSGGPLGFFASNYGVLADTQINWAPSWSSGSNIVTCATCNFSTTAKVGQIVFGTNQFPTGFTNNSVAVVQLPQTTIQSIDSNTQIHTVGNANANYTQGPLIWGDDDSTAIANAWTAASNACGILYFPAGRSLVQQGEFNTAPAACVHAVAANRQGPGVFGAGMGTTMLIPTPNFQSSTCTGGGVTSFACFFGTAAFNSYDGGMQVKDFTIWGGGVAAIGAGFNGKAGALFQANSLAQNFTIAGWGGATAGFVGIDTSAPPVVFYNVSSDGAGSTPCLIDTGEPNNTTIFNGVFCGDSNGGPGIDVKATATLQSTGSQYFPLPPGANGCAVQVEGTFQSNGDLLGSSTGTGTGVCVHGASGIANITNGIMNASGATTNSALWLNVSGAKAYVSNTFMQGGATAQAMNVVAGASFFDGGGNQFSGARFTGAGSWVPYKSAAGACTGTATASQTLGLYGTGPNETVTTCTSTTIGSGLVMDHAGTLSVLQASSTAGGVNASSGVVTVLKNGAGTTITCTFGTGTSCVDGAHNVAFVTGDLISLQFTTQAAETLAGVKASVNAY